jgi:hypothetical protein
VTQRDCCVLGLTGKQQSKWTPDRDATTYDDNFSTADRYAVRLEEYDDAVRGARKRRGDTEYESPKVDRMQAVGILRWIHEFENAIGVKPRGERQLHDVAGDRRIRIERSYGVLDLLLSGVGGHIHPDGRNADLSAVTMLATDVRMASWIVSNKHRRQTRTHATSEKSVNTNLQLRLDSCCRSHAIEDRCGHVSPIRDQSVKAMYLVSRNS